MLNVQNVTAWLSQLEEDIANQNLEQFGMHSDGLLGLLRRSNRIERSRQNSSIHTSIDLDQSIWLKTAAFIGVAQGDIRRGDFALALASLRQAREWLKARA
jgi:hypothetical protein